jgi:hypothetical protein
VDKTPRGKSRHTWRPWTTPVLSLHRHPGTANHHKRLRKLGDHYLATLTTARELSAEIEQEIEIAKAAGSSLAEIGAASGLSVPQLEYILVSVSVQRDLAGYSQSRWGDTVIPYPRAAADRHHHGPPKRLA